MGQHKKQEKGQPRKGLPIVFLENSITKLETRQPRQKAEKPDCPIILMEDEKDEFLHQFASRRDRKSVV